MKIAITGLLRSGKNHIAQQLGLNEIGFADPLKRYVDAFAPPGADKNFLRKAYQDFGQWGRGSLDVPFSAERAVAVQMARTSGHEVTGMGRHWSWIRFGSLSDFWVRLLLARISITELDDVAVCDVRFENELEALKKDGFVHLHVMCSEETRKERAGDNYDPDALLNVSEAMAKGLDDAVISGEGIDAVVIWNDDRPPHPLMKGFFSTQEITSSWLLPILEGQPA